MSFLLKIFTYVLPTILEFFTKKFLAWQEQQRIKEEIKAKNAAIRKQLEEAQSKEERDAAAQRIADNF